MNDHDMYETVTWGGKLVTRRRRSAAADPVPLLREAQKRRRGDRDRTGVNWAVIALAIGAIILFGPAIFTILAG